MMVSANTCHKQSNNKINWTWEHILLWILKKETVIIHGHKYYNDSVVCDSKWDSILQATQFLALSASAFSNKTHLHNMKIWCGHLLW